MRKGGFAGAAIEAAAGEEECKTIMYRKYGMAS